jgi:hypothetical protein
MIMKFLYWLAHLIDDIWESRELHVKHKDWVYDKRGDTRGNE